mgnify:CR=1 FL=1
MLNWVYYADESNNSYNPVWHSVWSSADYFILHGAFIITKQKTGMEKNISKLTTIALNTQ